MILVKKYLLLTFSLIILLSSSLKAEEEEVQLKQVSDQIQVLIKDLKTLEKAVYQKSDVISSSSSSLQSSGLNEDILTKHLLKLNEIEDQFRQLTNKFEEVNFKLDKLSSRVTKIQSDTQLRFSDLENSNVEMLSIGSSLKICMVAEGSADVYPRYAPTMEWDTAAGHAIANMSGYKIFEFQKDQEIRYNKENLLNPWFLVTKNES